MYIISKEKGYIVPRNGPTWVIFFIAWVNKYANTWHFTDCM